MKKRQRLTKEEANHLKLPLKEKGSDGRNPRYSLTSELLDELKELRGIPLTTKTSSKSNNYVKDKFVLSAWNSDGYMMDIDQYCEHYKLPKADIRSYKLVSHTGTPFYNIVFKENTGELSEFNIEEIRDILNREISKTYVYKNNRPSENREGVLKWSDLHFGALIEGLSITKNFNKDILLDGLLESIKQTNRLNFSTTHIHINGDLIESFTGLNHINSFLSLDPKLIGSNAIMLCCDMLETAFRRVDNLGKIKIVAGNHDRTSSSNKEDVKGQAAELIAWGLKLKGFDVEFDPLVITHEVDGINHINLHGDKGISKRTTEKILWEYGRKGVFNFIFEGHLHSLIQKLTTKQRQNYNTIKDSAVDHMRMHLASFFTGNFFSESLGFSSIPGYSIIWNNGNGTPQIFNGTL